MFFSDMVRHFSKSGEFVTCPLVITVKAVCQRVLRIGVCQGVQTSSTDMYAIQK